MSAGNLNPPSGAPSPTMNSLQELGSVLVGSTDTSGVSADIDGNINEQLKYISTLIGTKYTYGDEDSSKVLTTATGAGTYNATNLVPDTVADGVLFGVSSEGELLGDTNSELVAGTAEYAGTLLANLAHGRNTADTFDVDDYNNGGAPATNRYETSWTKCNSGNSYCGASDSRASAMDDVTGLIWSYPCSGTNCSNMTDETDANYDHVTALTNCSNQSPWRLPTQKELMIAYANGAYGNLIPQGPDDFRLYWSATSYSPNTSDAWLVLLSYGGTHNLEKTIKYYVRCVRSAT